MLQLQPFSPNFLKFWAPPHDLALFLNRRILELIGWVLISNDCADWFSVGFKGCLCLNFVIDRRCEFGLLASDKSDLLFFESAVSEVKLVLNLCYFSVFKKASKNLIFSLNWASHYVKSAAFVLFPFAVAAPKSTKHPKSKALRLPTRQYFSRLPVTFLLPPLRLPKWLSFRSVKPSDLWLRVFPPAGHISLTFPFPPLRLGKSFGFWCKALRILMKTFPARISRVFSFFFSAVAAGKSFRLPMSKLFRLPICLKFFAVPILVRIHRCGWG